MCFSPIMPDCSRHGFLGACYCLSAPSPSASHTYIICISSSEGGRCWPGKSQSVKDEGDRQWAGVGVLSECQGPVSLCTGWEDTAWLWGCPWNPVGLDAERDGPTGLQPAVLHSAGLQSRGCSSVFLIWLNSDLGGKNSKERMSEGPGKMTQWMRVQMQVVSTRNTKMCYIFWYLNVVPNGLINEVVINPLCDENLPSKTFIIPCSGIWSPNPSIHSSIHSSDIGRPNVVVTQEWTTVTKIASPVLLSLVVIWMRDMELEWIGRCLGARGLGS